MTRSLGWCFTLNNYTEEERTALIGTQCRYMVVGREIGAEGTNHLQGFVQFEKPGKTLAACKKLNARAHWESSKGSIDQNYAYCTKDGDFEEVGVKPMTQQKKGEAEKHRWDEILSAAQDGRLEDIPAEVRLKYPRNIAYIRQEATRKQVLKDTEEENLWIYGPTKTGKSLMARTLYPDLYLKMCNKWWDGYEQQDVVLLEDFDQQHDKLVHYLKIWADRYPFPAETKGGSFVIRPRRIIVTSNYHPEDIWTKQPDLAPILRRFKLIPKFEESNGPPQCPKDIVESPLQSPEEIVEAPPAKRRRWDGRLSEAELVRKYGVDTNLVAYFTPGN